MFLVSEKEVNKKDGWINPITLAELKPAKAYKK